MLESRLRVLLSISGICCFRRSMRMRPVMEKSAVGDESRNKSVQGMVVFIGGGGWGEDEESRSCLSGWCGGWGFGDFPRESDALSFP